VSDVFTVGSVLKEVIDDEDGVALREVVPVFETLTGDFDALNVVVLVEELGVVIGFSAVVVVVVVVTLGAVLVEEVRIDDNFEALELLGTENS
jgi:hypothetical protein